MKLFNIYIKKSPDESIEDLIAVKSGGSFWAFCFNILWFLQHKMWKESAALILVNVVFIYIFKNSYFGYLNIITIEFGLSLIIALNANYWYGQSLLNNNYNFYGCAFAKNQEDAKLHFIKNCFDSKLKNNSIESIFSPSIFDLKKPKNNASSSYTKVHP
jgi:hypothetical protein